MGIIYSKAESKKFIENIQNNIKSGIEVTTDLKQGSHNVVQAVDGRSLSGAAYTAGKNLFSELIIPTISRCHQSLQEVEKDLSTYISANNAIQEASQETLDEEKLEAKIRESEMYRNTVSATASALSNQAFDLLAMTNPVTAVISLANHLFDVQGKLNRYVESLDQDIEKLKKDLRLLQNFGSQVQGLFNNSLNNFKIAMQSVLVLNNTKVNSDGTYTLPAGVDKSWFTDIKSETSIKEIGLQSILSIDDAVIDKLGLTSEQKDWYKRIKGMLKSNPAKAYELLYKDSDTLWAVVSEISKKYPSVADKFLDAMIGLEKIGNTKAAEFLKAGIDKFGNVTSPVKYLLKNKLGVGKILENSKLISTLGKGGSIVKFVGKAGTVATFASLAVDGISGGINDGIKQKSIGKGVIGGIIDTVKSIGPLEGMAVGATIGSLFPGPGTVIGGGVGLAIGGISSVIQLFKPHLVSNIKKSAFEAYDKGVNEVKAIGKSVVQDINTVKNVVSNFIEDPIGTWNIGSQLTEDISKMIPKFPKVPEIKFGG
ncbi:T7SS effector LXG polymorphic toxin [Enterococcus faecium]|uniref:T7SS effector LXG polymorphic toxin n=1 Tax=Enterococcus faecium TaxID=1352 RepID=UPI0027EDA088|nr:hypothetical protein [Enterococcus faecalis]EKZ0111183.1 hypothetical protein [Enterococcus faecalis]